MRILSDAQLLFNARFPYFDRIILISQPKLRIKIVAGNPLGRPFHLALTGDNLLFVASVFAGTLFEHALLNGLLKLDSARIAQFCVQQLAKISEHV